MSGIEQTSTIILIDEKNHRFLRLRTIDPLGRIFHPYVCCRIFSNIFGLYTLDASCTPPHCENTECCQMSLGGGNIVTPSPSTLPALWRNDLETL